MSQDLKIAQGVLEKFLRQANCFVPAACSRREMPQTTR
jgi:hypothetical protein